MPNSTALCSGRDTHQNPCVESCRLVCDRCPPRTTSSLLRFCETERCVKLRDVPVCCRFHCVLSMSAVSFMRVQVTRKSCAQGQYVRVGSVGRVTFVMVVAVRHHVTRKQSRLRRDKCDCVCPWFRSGRAPHGSHAADISLSSVLPRVSILV